MRVPEKINFFKKSLYSSITVQDLEVAKDIRLASILVQYIKFNDVVHKWKLYNKNLKNGNGFCSSRKNFCNITVKIVIADLIARNKTR